ncbi:MAG: creatininase family protein [Haloarculaceae archaeon]
MYYESIGTADAEWAGKPYAEIAEIADRDGSVLVVPVGSIEQHGHHLPVATDTLLVDAVVAGAVERAETDAGEAPPLLVTPPVWSGFSPHHLPFGGTISLSLEDLRAVLETVARRGVENGFDAVAFVNGHGGNEALVSAVVSTAGHELDAETVGVTYFRLATDEVREIRESDPGGMAHGGEYETSLVLHLRPDLVGGHGDREGTMGEGPYEWTDLDLLGGGPLSVYRPFDDYSETGAIGAPELADAEKGERIYEAVTRELAALLTAVHEEAA